MEVIAPADGILVAVVSHLNGAQRGQIRRGVRSGFDVLDPFIRSNHKKVSGPHAVGGINRNLMRTMSHYPSMRPNIQVGTYQAVDHGPSVDHQLCQACISTPDGNTAADS